MKNGLFFIFLLVFFNLNAQVYEDYIGAGHFQGVKISTSDDSNTSQNQAADGAGLNTDLKGSARFLNQASMGADFETIQNVANIGLSTWLDQQIALPPQVSFTDTTEMIWEHFVAKYVEMYGENEIIGNNDILLSSIYWRMAYWNNVLKSKDILRQRVALALSEILVISERSDLEIACYGLSDYYDLLYQNSFENYRDLLFGVTMHPSMGYYLSHLNNPKSDIANNIHPDENYAREVMQLFSIGLYELNLDGTRKIDTNGNYIPTYSNDDIKEFAKIFTGFAPGQYYWQWDAAASNIPVEFGSYRNIPYFMNMRKPMQIMDDWHETGEKQLLNGKTVSSGQTGIKDVNDAIDNLFNHPNVAPFISRLLIQRLVKSNPSPAYIERVSTVFNNDGKGERGNLGAVVKALLLDSEARDCSWLEDTASGKLREPFVKTVQLLKSFNAYNESDKLYGLGFIVNEVSKQHVLNSPSVFNFFLPDFQPNGDIADANLVAPEFQLHTSSAAIGNLNFLYDSFLGEIYLFVSTESNQDIIGIPEFNFSRFNPKDKVQLDLSDELALKNNPKELVDRLDIILTGGQLSEKSKEIILETITPLIPFEDYAVKTAFYLITLSPDYNIRK